MKLLQNLLVGLLFFGALGTVGYLTIMSDASPLASRGDHMVLFFDNADGIKRGSRVTVLGVPHGSVVDVGLVAVDRDNKPVGENATREVVGQKVAVTIEMNHKIKFYDNYKIAIKSESLLSDKLVAIDPGSALNRKTGGEHKSISVFSASDKRMREEQKSAVQIYLSSYTGNMAPENDAPRPDGGPSDPSLKRPDFVALDGETSGDPIAGVTKLIEENRANVRKTIENIADITGKINRGDGTVGRLINSDELHRSANDLVTDAQIVIKELRESLEDTREQAPVTSFIRAALTSF